MNSRLAAPLAVALLFLVGGVALVLTSGSCGGGGTPPPTGGSGALTVTAATPDVLDSELHTGFEVAGTGFYPVGSAATVRLDAVSGTPFLGGTQASVEMSGTIDTETEISGVTGACGVSEMTDAYVTVILPDSSEATSSDPLVTIYPPVISTFAPSNANSGESVPFLMMGDGFGQAGSTLTVRFTAVSATPFVGGTQASADVIGSIDTSQTISGMTPAGVAGFDPVEVIVGIVCPSGTEVDTGLPVFTILPVPQLPEPPPGLPEGAGFGGAMDIEGDIAAVAAPGGGDAEGTVVLYMWNGEEWVLSAILSPDDLAANSLFGASVAVSGNTVIVGAPHDDHGTPGNRAGSAYVYVYDPASGLWSLQQKLVAPDSDVQDHFGETVAIDGDTAAVGAPYKDGGGGNRSGAVYVWTRSGGTWTVQQTLSAPDGSVQDCFGIALALQGDTVVAGACFEDETASNAGAAYVFTRSGGVWTQQAKLRASDGAAGDEFAGRLVLDGSTLVAAAPGADVGGHADAGAVYVFVESGGTWTEQAKLTAADASAGDAFGLGLDLAGDLVVVGAPLRDGATSDEGSAYKFERSGGSWSQTGQLFASSPAAGDRFGAAVVIWNGLIFVGAPGLDTYGPDAGGVFVY